MMPGRAAAQSGLKVVEPLREVVPPVVDERGLVNPIDRLLAGYLAEHGVSNDQPVDDRTFAGRVGMDLIGLRLNEADLAAFVGDDDAGKRDALVTRLLGDRRNYTEHWLTFWNDALRNGYRGTGFIDDGRRQITGWLYRALYENKPFDEFVRELIDPVEGSEGYVKGIQWRGTVNASQRKEMQAAQSVSQVFLGLNLKCASCHNSFVNEWKLEDAYAMAAVFAEQSLEIHRCDKPVGQMAEPRFLFEGLGGFDAGADAAARQTALAEMLTDNRNGRLARTIVNRLWAKMMGRGLVEPLDDMTGEAWAPDLLEWLAGDLVAHGWDVKRTLSVIATSRVYQMRAVAAAGDVGTSRDLAHGEDAASDGFVFQGPLVKRMTAEQFVDAVNRLAGVKSAVSDGMLNTDGRGQGGQWAASVEVLGNDVAEHQVRAALMDVDALQAAMGRSNREQVVTRRGSAATTLEALELTNGETLDAILREGGEHWAQRYDGQPAEDLAAGVYRAALGREPSGVELAAATELLGGEVSAEGAADLLWIVTMLPEFQLVY